MNSLWKLLTLGCLPILVGAHGVDVVTLTTAQGLQASYSDGTPMSWAEVSLYRPGSDAAFSSGYADDNGCYAFVPDTAGTWRVIFNDGMGHGVDHSFTVNAELLLESGTPTGPIPLLYKVFSGLAIIFGITALLYAHTLRRAHPA